MTVDGRLYGRRMHSPWRAFRDLTDWTLHWAHLPVGIFGITDFESKSVILRHGMNQEERRCTIAHEVQHVIRGPVVASMRAREEEQVDRNAACLLLPDVKLIGEALAWSLTVEEAASELWVDTLTLHARLRALRPAERSYLNERLADD